MAKTGLFNPPVSVQITDTAIIGPDPNRVGLILSPGPTNRYSIAFGTAAVLDQGLTIPPGVSPLILSLEDLGDLITLDIRGISAVAPQTITVGSITLAP